MSKKRFTEGLESLFTDITDTSEERQKSSPASPKEKVGKGGAGKDFSSDLHSFLQDAFDESFQEQLDREKQKKSPPKKYRRSASSGLDALIRNTLEPNSMRIDPEAKRRLVVTFKEEQLERLKAIARQEKTYLKKIINEIVEEYIRQYSQTRDEKGN